MKIFVIGHRQHGKDIFSEFLAEALGTTFFSSSLKCAELLLHKYGRFIKGEWYVNYGEESGRYQDVQAFYRDRGSHREWWYTKINSLAGRKGTAICDAIFEAGDIYCGIRSYREYAAYKFHNPNELIVTIVVKNANLPKEDISSNDIMYSLGEEEIDIVVGGTYATIDDYRRMANTAKNILITVYKEIPNCYIELN